MKKYRILLLACFTGVLFFTNCKQGVQFEAPIAPVDPKTLVAHGQERTDPYFWLQNRDDSAVVQYLLSENAYTDSMTKHTLALQDTIFNEISRRIKKTDESLPYKLNGFYYYTRTEGNNEYEYVCRKKGDMSAQEEILLNLPEMAENKSYFDLGDYEVSPDNQLVAYSVDDVSRRLYTIYIKSIYTNKQYTDEIKNTLGGMAWANDNKTLFYVKKDTATLLPFQVYRHVLGTNQNADVLVYEEKDNSFYTNCYKSKSGKFIYIALESTTTSEYLYLDAGSPLGEFKPVQPRERGLEYSVKDFDGHFYVLTNHNALNFKIVKAPVNNPSKENWIDVLPYQENTFIVGFEVFKNFMAINQRVDGLPQIKIIKWASNEQYLIEFNEETYLAHFGVNLDFETDLLQYRYNSLTTPSSVFSYNMKTHEQQLLKQEEILGGFNKSEYESKRLFATAKDGTKIPISLVYKKGILQNGENPLFISGYGAYGSISEPYFSVSRVSLLNRGFIFAIAHVRGGQEMGRQWYEQGKLLNKINTFSDFNVCTQHLIDLKYTSANKVVAYGASAGGLLMGAIVNMQPNLYRAVIAGVPFVDVVTTMLDASIPLTAQEYDEWGNPNQKEYYDYMLSYSPYDNVKKQNYPAMLVTTGFHDSQVQYWEPAKWVAKLRATKTDKNSLLLKTYMDFGHGGASGRFQMYREVAFDFAFALDMVGIKN